VLRELGDPPVVTVPMEPEGLLAGPGFPGVGVATVPIAPQLLYWRELMVTWRSSRSGYSGEIAYRPSCVSDATGRALGEEILAVVQSVRSLS
jgi:hypothetical protein